MKWVSRCPICGGELAEDFVEKLLRGGRNVASVKVKARVCRKCGEIVYDAVTIQRFQAIREKLERNDVADFSLLGKAYAVK
jgi:YgiT-type zinc finger domain-containing protein